MADEGDEAGHQGDANHVAADHFHQLADDHVEHTGVGHDTEVEDGEDEQSGGLTGGVEAGLHKRCDIIEAVVAGNHQNQSQDGGEYDECNAGKCLALEQSHDNGDNGQEAKYAYKNLAHTVNLFLYD